MGVRAAIFPAPGRAVEVRELPDPELAPGDALLRVIASEVCGTDVHLHEGRLAGVPYPLIPGHVSVGQLEAIRGELRDVRGRRLEEGALVTFLDVFGTCGRCEVCLIDKATTRCPQRKVYGITYADGLRGGWAEKLHLAAGTHILSLEGIPPERFMRGGCALPTAVHAIERGRVQLAERVLVLGSGPVGLAAVALARLSGAGQVLCIGGPEARLACARAMGADATLDIASADPAARLDWVRAQTGGRGADLSIEVAGPAPAALEALRFTRDAGRVVIAGQYTNSGEAALNPHLDINTKHLEVRGCWGCDFSHLQRALDIMASPILAKPWDALELTRYGLDELDAALRDVASGAVLKALVDPSREKPGQNLDKDLE